MFSTFTTKHGHLIIRTQDVRRIEDVSLEPSRGTQIVDGPKSQCVVTWATQNDTNFEYRTIEGTAAENFARLKREELEMIAEAERLQQQSASKSPIAPVARGRIR